MIRRRDIHGHFLVNGAFQAKCHECGMPLLAANEYHPFEACVVFKRTQDSNDVWAELAQHFLRRKAAPVERERAT